MNHVFLGGYAHSADNMRALATALGLDPKVCHFITPVELAPSLAGADKNQSSPSCFVSKLKTLLAGKESISLYGWSIGGMFAIELCHFFPDNIERLVLISSCASFVARDDCKEPRESEESVLALARALREKPRVAFTRFLRRCFGSARPTEAIVEQHLEYALSIGSSESYLRYLAESDLREYARNLRMEVSLFHGSRDKVIHVDVSRSLQSIIPSATLYVLDGMGHNLPLQCASQIADYITQLPCDQEV